MPDGAILAEELFERRGSDSRVLGIFVMTKQNGAWQFSIEKGVEATSDTALCESCHRDAPRDSVFDLGTAPRDGERSASSPAPGSGDASADAVSESIQGLPGRATATAPNVVDAASETRARSDGGQ
jgi:hypothetical protein